ncbi:hypothetical protein [Paractinoplanes atraurantiacus]|uniref:hypothetical protein n=1 Tax=Paractinoplanes atraurantiacus TaxID=1036182 RepID=UPI001FE61427|nr:hypothetical protein [Actinoplanes atraurantiacus]
MQNLPPGQRHISFDGVQPSFGLHQHFELTAVDGPLVQWPDPCDPVFGVHLSPRFDVERCATRSLTLAVLVATLPDMMPTGRTVALDLLSTIATAKVTGPAHEQIGAVDAGEIRQAVTAGFPHYVAVLRAESGPSADRAEAIAVLRQYARAAGHRTWPWPSRTHSTT